MPVNPRENLLNNHTLFMGKSGSGKTYTIKNHPLVKKDGARVVVWDPYESHDVFYTKSLPEFGKNLADAVRSGKGFRIGLAVNPDLDAFEMFCRMVWAMADGTKQTIVIVEELADVAGPGKASQAWGTMVRVGRKYGLVLFPATQRPQEVDKTIFTQASRVWVGLVSNYDHKYVQRNTGISVEQLESIAPESYRFYFVHGNEISEGGPGKAVKL